MDLYHCFLCLLQASNLFHIKPDFLVKLSHCLWDLDFHISRGIILDTSDFTQYLDRHSKPDRPVRGQSFISFSLRSGSITIDPRPLPVRSFQFIPPLCTERIARCQNQASFRNSRGLSRR